MLVEKEQYNLKSEEPEWLAIYKQNSIKAHQLRQVNDYAGAKQLFEEALNTIQEAKQQGIVHEKLAKIQQLQLQFSSQQQPMSLDSSYS